MKAYAIIKNRFQNQIGKDYPKVIKLFQDLSSAQEFADNMHAEIWRDIFSEGVRNDSFEYYREFILSNGFDINSKSIVNAKEFVKFLNNAKMPNVYGEESPLSELKIVEIIELDDIKEFDSSTRFLIIEDSINTYSDMYSNYNEENIGMPCFCFDSQFTAEKKLMELNLTKVKNNILRNDAIENLKDCFYWNQDFMISEKQIKEVEHHFSINKLKHELDKLEDIDLAVRIISDVTGVGFIYYFSLQKIDIEQ